MMRFAPYLIGAILMVGAYWLGSSTASSRYEQRIEESQEYIDDLSETLKKSEQQRAALRESREALLKELSNEAAEDPNADRPALGRDSMRRLNRIQ